MIVDRVLTLVRTAGRRLQGERRLPFFFLALPILIMLLVGTVFGVGGKKLVVGVAAPKNDALAQDLIARMHKSDIITPRHLSGPASVRNAVRRGRLSGGLVIPNGYGAAVRGGRDPAVQVIVQPGRAETIEARLGISAILARENVDIVVARQVQRDTGKAFDQALAIARRQTRDVPDYVKRDKKVSSPFSYTAPSNLVLFAFIAALVTSGINVVSRRLGVTRRVLASPTPAVAVVISELTVTFFVAVFQAATMLVVGAVFFGVDFGPPLDVIIVVVAFALVCASAGGLLSTLVRTPEQTVNFGPPIGIALGMLGGCMWPLEGVGPLLRAIGHLAPQAWAMDAFVALIFGHDGFRGIIAPVGALLAFSVVLMTVATLRLRKAVITA